jgi:hypothetical protein
MSEDSCRSIGAIIGLALGIVLMRVLDLSGMVAAALFGAGGCVAGAVTAEKLHAWNKSRGE